ncbi:MAG: Rieske 2Fe-2S domain-containing protein [Leptolyngbyaceae cyanobacterium bins.59]|nr:Rieske 2Fe-2S domain-containing protein [Leptolyngbyaceae cyanobacterium bins.59]
MNTALTQFHVFNQPDRFVEGWYWVLPSRELKIGAVKPVTVLGRDLALYRGQDGGVTAIDAYCPHMGAHLAEGRVEGNHLRCFFHNWKFNTEGHCIEAPSLEKAPPVQVKRWPTAEAYGLIWIWAGETPHHPLPFVPELEQDDCEAILGSRFIKNCHPNVVMINAIDAHHFNTVHHFPVKIHFTKRELNGNAIQFNNTTRGGEDSLLVRLLLPLYQNEATYSLCYWYGMTGSVTLGPDRLHFHILFALRLIEGGRTEGQTVLVTKRRSFPGSFLFQRAVLDITRLVGNYFAKGDTRIFQTIQFNLKTPTREDQAIVQFIHHLEQQQALQWKTWEVQKAQKNFHLNEGGKGTIAGFSLPALAKENRLHQVLDSALEARSGLSSLSPSEDSIAWPMEFFGLHQVKIFQESSSAEQQAILQQANRGLLEEAYWVEKAGMGYMAKMALLAENTEERMLYNLFAADETLHMAQLSAFLPHSQPANLDDPFLRFLSDLAECPDRQVLLFVIQIVLEGWGLSHYRDLSKHAQHPALATLFRNFLQEESRHHASGVTLFNQAVLSQASRSILFEALERFLGMVRPGPQRLVGKIATIKGGLSSSQAAQVFEELQTEVHSGTRLRLLRSLMRGETANGIVQELDDRGAFQPLSVAQCVQLWKGQPS